ncbi:hypothetical protein EDB81DRAFT_847043 [Dactylonectria macrodidyma]|uniref:NAD(P)-binding domain-containing protein n=1 Tax=Dactylonectria macrodidyma TaxID=307937 RepID=A0A9P9DQD3_9HYPO|nr:hypothetical protein EDB81DRAFT_847043 [Dactylonectria macrodidyma]
MASFRKVALIGKGLLGSAVLESLYKHGFEVTVLSRDPASISGLPAGVSASRVDYSSVDSLTSALRSQEAVIATLRVARILGQKVIIDATASLLQNYPLVQIQNYLKEKAAKGELEYTILSISGFLDLLLDMPFLLDFLTSSVEFFNKGQHPFSMTTLAGIRTAQETYFNAKTEFEKALENVVKDPSNFGLILPLFKASLLSGKFTATYSSVDNGLVGLPLLDDEHLECKLARKIQEKTHSI